METHKVRKDVQRGAELQPTAVPFTQEGGFFLRSWGPVSANEDGYFILPMLLNGASISIQCESAPVVSLVAATGTTPGQLGEITIPSSGAPIVSALTASFNGTVIAQLAAPGAPRPSDKVPQADKFLAFFGLDSRLSACRYYQAIGAVASCDASGNFSGAISSRMLDPYFVIT